MFTQLEVYYIYKHAEDTIKEFFRDDDNKQELHDISVKEFLFFLKKTYTGELLDLIEFRKDKKDQQQLSI